MLHLFIVTFAFLQLHLSCCSECPAMFKRLSEKHSFCQPRNPKCNIISTGLKSEEEKEEILREHNKYRSKCAIGKETGAGGLPTAADMMEMVWDEELAAVAQKWAEQCRFEHDCTKCRAVFSYRVGQNIAYKEWSCRKGDCRSSNKQHPRNWTAIIKLFTDEISVFHKDLVKSMQFEHDESEKYGHLTQILWAKTWRIGCGYVAHLYRNSYRQLYVCNYGPGGNIISKPLYAIGKPCSRCPSNTCCGESCKRGNIYPGLCCMLDKNGVPIYDEARKRSALFYRDFGKHIPADFSIIGENKWKIRSTHSGNILSIVLNGGESSILRFNQAIAPSDAFCMTMKYRKGPNEAGRKDSNEFEMFFEVDRSTPVNVHIRPSSADFFTYNLDLNWKRKTKFSLKFSAPPSSPPQYLDVQSIIITNGKCKTND